MTDTHSATNSGEPSPTLFGHPTGLFTLFFAEMWERFSYYGMRALLVFYMIKGFLKYNDAQAYAVYGSYTALVYATPFFGGMIADRLLGKRLAVIIGGLLMAAGHLLMTSETELAFFHALALLIVGNGFFKPNISTMVGSLYPTGSTRKSGGFTIFYMGINLGAAMSPILCGYVGETYGWHYGFGLATAGMLVGVAVFVAPNWLTQVLIGVGALGTACAMPFLSDTAVQLAVRVVLSTALVAAGIAAVVALGRGGLPPHAGGKPENAPAKLFGFPPLAVVLVGVAVLVPALAFIVQPDAKIGGSADGEGGYTIAGIALNITGILAVGYILFDAFARCRKVERERLFVALILMFFSVLFWAFFEQAGSSLNNFADRNVDRVFEERTLTEADVGKTLRFRVTSSLSDAQQKTDPTLAAEILALPLLTQEQLGFARGESIFNMTELSKLRGDGTKDETPLSQLAIDWPITPAHVGMNVGGNEIPASEFQAANPMFILLFGLVFSSLWTFLGRRKLDPNPGVKFALGLIQLGAGFWVLYYGASHADSRGMVGMTFLVLGYMLHTTGELCLSPVGLSTMTSLSPTRIVSTVMGAWFLATAFSQYLAGVIAQFTGVSHEGEGGASVIPAPIETVNVYGDVFHHIAIAAVASGVLLLLLTPLLKMWSHEGVELEEEPAND